eukprot:4382471-Prymnesium_polylepis.1
MCGRFLFGRVSVVARLERRAPPGPPSAPRRGRGRPEPMLPTRRKARCPVKTGRHIYSRTSPGLWLVTALRVVRPGPWTEQ